MDERTRLLAKTALGLSIGPPFDKGTNSAAFAFERVGEARGFGELSLTIGTTAEWFALPALGNPLATIIVHNIGNADVRVQVSTAVARVRGPSGARLAYEPRKESNNKVGIQISIVGGGKFDHAEWGVYWAGGPIPEPVSIRTLLVTGVHPGVDGTYPAPSVSDTYINAGIKATRDRAMFPTRVEFAADGLATYGCMAQDVWLEARAMLLLPGVNPEMGLAARVSGAAADTTQLRVVSVS